MKIFFDSEFHTDHRVFDLISIGVVKETGETLYLVSAEFDPEICSEWVKANVLPKLGNHPRHSLPEIRKRLVEFLPPPEKDGWRHDFWGYYCAQDWVILTQLFINSPWPAGWPRYAHELMQYFKGVGGHLPNKPWATKRHNALEDALWVKRAYEKLAEKSKATGIIPGGSGESLD